MPQNEVEWFGRETIDQCPWSTSHEAQFVRGYWAPMVRDGATEYTSNLSTEAAVIRVGDTFLPVTVNADNYESSYVCSPFTHFISYAIVELQELKQPMLEWLIQWLLLSIGGFLKWGKVNRVVHVNNYLLSTNLYPPLTEAQIQQIVAFVKLKFPTHSIVFRSLNTNTCAHLIDHVKNCGARMVATRQVYVFPGTSIDAVKKKKRRDIRKDKSLIEKHGYEIIKPEQLTSDDIARCVDLYNALYIDKYSELNPQFTRAWMQLVVEEKAMVVYALKKNGKLDGVLGYFWVGGVLTTPLFGYDTTLPKETGLYRMLSALTLEQSFARGVLDHASSGVADFKRNRGYVGALEYSGVIFDHLPWRQRSAWQLLELLTQKIAIPLLEKHEL